MIKLKLLMIKLKQIKRNITNRLNAEISAFPEGDLDKYEFLTREDLNALDKAKFEFSPLGKAFNQGLDKKAENYKEEGVIKLLKDIRDRMVWPIGNVNNRNNGDDDNNDDNNDDNRDDDNRDDDNRDDDRNNGDDKIAEMDSIDLSWMNNLQLYRQIAPEVFARYNRDKDSFELFTLRTFIDNINDEHVKNKKDVREEFKIVKKNVKSEALKEIVKDLEQAIFGDDDNDENLLEAEKLDRRLKNLISKKRRESLREYLKESEDANSQDRVNALRKKLNNLPKTIDKTSDNNDSKDNQISNFVDKVLKKVSKEIVNDDIYL